MIMINDGDNYDDDDDYNDGDLRCCDFTEMYWYILTKNYTFVYC